MRVWGWRGVVDVLLSCESRVSWAAATDWASEAMAMLALRKRMNVTMVVTMILFMFSPCWLEPPRAWWWLVFVGRFLLFVVDLSYVGVGATVCTFVADAAVGVGCGLAVGRGVTCVVSGVVEGGGSIGDCSGLIACACDNTAASSDGEISVAFCEVSCVGSGISGMSDPPAVDF